MQNLARQVVSGDGNHGPDPLDNLASRELAGSNGRRSTCARARSLTSICVAAWGGVRVGGRWEAWMANQGTGDDFVGRGVELAMLDRALREARAGRPTTVAVEGEPASGRHGCCTGSRLRCQILRCCGPAATRPRCRLITALPGSCGPECLPGWGLTVSYDPPGAGAAAGGFAVGAALLDVLGTLQQRGTVAVVVDDLQWADLPSARALLFALRRLRQDNILVLLASRPIAWPGWGTVGRGLLAERARRIRLHGLTPPDLQPLAWALLGVDLTLAARERLCEHTGGNPLYVRALLEELPAEPGWLISPGRCRLRTPTPPSCLPG